MAEATNDIIVTVPRYYASAIQQFTSPNDVMLVFGHSAPVLKDGGFGEPVSQPVAIVNMSPQAAKELALLLLDAVGEVEKTYGPLRTAFIDARAK